MSIYYVYFYLREDFTPYYVGKGKGRRAWSKGKREIHPPKDKSRIILVEQNLTEIQSLILERYYIRWFGRKDNGTGILRNRTDGGDGTSGIIRNQAGKVACKNKDNNLIFLEKNDPRLINEEFVPLNKGKSLYTNGTDFKILSPNDELVISGKYKRTTEGKCQVVINGKTTLVSIEEKNEKGYVSTNQGKVPARDKFGNTYLIPKDDIRLSSGELIVSVGKTISIRNEFTGKIMSIKNGEKIPKDFVGINKGGYKNLVTACDIDLNTYRVFKSDQRLGKTLYACSIKSGKVTIINQKS